MRLFKNGLKSILLMQLILGLIAIVFVIVGLIKNFHSGFTLVGIIILGIMMVMNGFEQYLLHKKKGYLFFTIIVSAAFIYFWIWRFTISV